MACGRRRGALLRRQLHQLCSVTGSSRRSELENGTFDAQIGHGNGTVTNTVIRTGKNDLHGSAYYVFQNTYLNANTYEKAGNGLARNNDQWSQTGLVIDGPVRIPKVYNGATRPSSCSRSSATHAYSPELQRPRTDDARTRRRLLRPLLHIQFQRSVHLGRSALCAEFSCRCDGNRTAYYANNNIASR